MYDGIFDDVAHVKEVLASHGHTLVDETLVFELLEDLKVKEHVVKVLLGNRLKVNSNLDDPWNPSCGVSPNAQATISEGKDSVIFPDMIEDLLSSDDLEVVEHKTKNETHVIQANNEAVDLTMDDNQSSSNSTSSFSNSTEKFDHKEIKTKTEEPVAGSEADSLIDLTKEIMEVKEWFCSDENSKDMVDVKGEEADTNNFTTDSESEMDDYYRRRDMESEESDGFDESDGKVTPPASPVLSICQNFDIPANNEPMNIESGENRIEEMLEENNNDPNNNLEDIEVLEHNNSSATTIENLNIEKEPVEDRCESPKPGCSKDSYYADTDFCITEGAASNGNQRFTVGKRPNIANIFEDEDFLVGNCVRLSDTKIGKEVFMIQKILPHLTKAKILSTIVENQEAVNRVELALWELLPDVKPAPIFHPKRKQLEDNCPAPVKKFLQEDSNCKKNPVVGSSDLVQKIASPLPAIKSIIKPATLKVAKTNKLILKPPTLELSNSKPCTVVTSNPKSKFTMIASSILTNLQSQRDSAAKIPNSISEKRTILNSKTQLKSSSKDNQPGGLAVNKTGAISKRTIQTEPFIPKELEKKSNDSTELGADISLAPQKLLIGSHNDYKVLKYQYPQMIVAKDREDLIKSHAQKTGAVPKQPAQSGSLKKVAKNATDFSELVTTAKEVLHTGAAAHLHILEKASIKNPEQSHSQSLKLPSDLTVPKLNDAAGYGYGHTGVAAHLHILEKASIKNPEQSHSQSLKLPPDLTVPKLNDVAGYGYGPSVSHKSELNVKLKVHRTEVAASLADVHPPEIENKHVHRPWTAMQHPIQNDMNAHIVQRVGNIQLENQNLLGNRMLNHAEVPKLDNLFQPLPVLDADEILEQLDNIPPASNSLVPAVAERMEPAKIGKLDPPKELFNPLINMFPDVDPNYISELCISAKLKNQGFESLLEILLGSGHMYPRIINPEPEPQEMNPDVQYENLQGIFPDAHPEYLRGIAEQYYNDPDAMKNFVQAKLENPDYPTMADYLKKIKITEQIRQYTVDFSAEKFLQIFPNPLTYFENPKRVHRYNVIAFEFLKCLFRTNKIATIQREYRSTKHPFHISLAAKALEFIGPDMKSRRPDKQLPTEDIPLLQEFAFIRHKAEIKEFISAQKLKEEQEFERLKKNNELLECQCCYDGECMPSKCMQCSEGHIFCNSCIKTGSETKIGEGQTQFPCFVECKGEFTLPVLQKILEPTMFSILLRKRQEEEVKAAGLEGLVSCPFCHFASIPPPEDKVFKCLNPECMKETCRLCKELNHVPLKCDEVTKGEEARHYLEEKMTEALVRKCYRCSRPFFKDEGCNKMTCPCGAMTCYICGDPVQDYRHFNGQGSDRTDLCPLWSDNKVLNAQTVRVVAEAAEKEILKKNPNLKIDAKALMPSMPQASRGPHQDIANAHILPVQARRA